MAVNLERTNAVGEQNRPNKSLSTSHQSVGTYVLITPARNEAKFIRLAIESLVAQTLHPRRWVIVSDGSTDGTNEIVREYTARVDWIELVTTPERKVRHFAAKVEAFNLGRQRVADIPYDVIGNLDADISIDDPTYFEFLMRCFGDNPRLGVAGTSFREGNIVYPTKVHSTSDVFGACQMFRRECFEEIGGYTPVHGGGIDMIAVLAAQAAGWQTQTFIERLCTHHRVAGSAHCSTSAGRLLQTGKKDYILGSHPAFEVLRSLYQMTNKPYVVGGVLMLFGYLWAAFSRAERPISPRLIDMRRRTQMSRLREIGKRVFASRLAVSESSRPAI